MRHLGFVLVALFGVHLAMPADAQTPPPAIEFNGAPLAASDRQTLQQLEAQIGQVPPGRYWYDARSGAAGVWGGPAVAYLGPRLPLGGPLPADASGGGNGRMTGVFVNGRELHPIDVQGLGRVLPVQRGRYWWDAAGNVGAEGGPALFNFYWVVQQQQRNTSGGSTYRRGSRSGESTFVGPGCVAVHGRLCASDESSSYSYYGGC